MTRADERATYDRGSARRIGAAAWCAGERRVGAGQNRSWPGPMRPAKSVWYRAGPSQQERPAPSHSSRELQCASWKRPRATDVFIALVAQVCAHKVTRLAITDQLRDSGGSKNVRRCECDGKVTPGIGYYHRVDLMNATFRRLNDGWNAEPNAPHPFIEVH